jgi:osmotically-inducible protein OsmY
MMNNHSTGLIDRIDQAIHSSPHLSRRRFHLEADSGVVRLQGTVDSYYQKQMAQEAIRHVEGVRQIDNQLQVQWQ